MSQISVSSDESSIERMDSSAASSPLNSSIEVLDSEDSSEVDVKAVKKDKPARNKEAILEEENLKLKATNEKLEAELISKDREIQKGQTELDWTKLEMEQWKLKWRIGVERSKKHENEKMLLKEENVKMRRTIRDLHALDEKNLELEAIIEEMEVEMRDKDQNNEVDLEIMKDQNTLLKEEIEKLKETIEKLEVELKNSKNQKDQDQIAKVASENNNQAAPQFASKLEGVWRMTIGDDAGTFTRFTTDSDCIMMELYDSAGKSQSYAIFPLSSKEYALQSSEGYIEYMDEDQWVSLLNGGKLEVMELEDGRLKNLFYEKEGEQPIVEYYEKVDMEPVLILVRSEVQDPTAEEIKESAPATSETALLKEEVLQLKEEIKQMEVRQQNKANSARRATEIYVARPKDEMEMRQTNKANGARKATAIYVAYPKDEKSRLEKENRELRKALLTAQIKDKLRQIEELRAQKKLFMSSLVSEEMKDQYKLLREKIDELEDELKDLKDQYQDVEKIKEMVPEKQKDENTLLKEEVLQLKEEMKQMQMTHANTVQSYVARQKDEKTRLEEDNMKLRKDLHAAQVEIKLRQQEELPVQKDREILEFPVVSEEQKVIATGLRAGLFKLEEKIEEWEKEIKKNRKRVRKIPVPVVEMDSKDQKDQKDQVTTEPQDQMKQLEKVNLQLKKELNSKDQKDQKDQKKKEEDLKDQLKALETENLQLKKDAKDQKDQEDQATPELIPILQEINGIWKMVSHQKVGNFPSRIGEFLKFESDSENITMEQFEATGASKSVLQIQLNTMCIEKQTVERFDYVDHNKWETFYFSTRYLNTTRSIVDGKLIYEYTDERGACYTNVYERVEKVVSSLPILQEINGIWKLVSETLPKVYGSSIGEFVKIEADSEQVNIENFKQNGVPYMVSKNQFQSKKDLAKMLDRLDYIEDNQWKTINKNRQLLDIVKSVRDGKLVYEYDDKEGNCYGRVYERVEKLPDAVKELEKEILSLKKELGFKDHKNQKDQKNQKKKEKDLKDQLKVLETENLNLKKELKTLPILQELNGTWKLTSVEKAGKSYIGELMRIEADSQLITVERFKKSGVSYKKTTFPLHSKVPSKMYDRLDYVENNQWKSVIMYQDGWNSVKSIKDGKLHFEFVDENWQIYTDVYTRVEGGNDVKDQKTPDPLPILQEINGIWKVISETSPDSYGSLIGEFLSIETDSEQAKVESFKPNGVSYMITTAQFLTTMIPDQDRFDRFDYVQNNQWKTVHNDPYYWNIVRSIRDGKLIYEYDDKKGKTYTDVFERVKEVPIPVDIHMDSQNELEELKDQMEQLENENLQLKKELDVKDQKDQKDQKKKEEDQKTPEPLPILQELNGNWKLISVERAEEKHLGQFMDITASSERIYVTRYRQTGHVYRGAPYPLHSKVPSKKPMRVDYVENNQWKTVDFNKGALNSVKSIQDGKLYFEFIDKKGNSYTDVYEKVDEIPNPYPKKEEEEEDLNPKDLDGQDEKLILKEVSGSWKLTSWIGVGGESKVGDLLIIKAHSDRIEIDQFDDFGAKIFSRTGRIRSKNAPFEKGSQQRDYIEGNEWVTLLQDDDHYKSVKTIKDGKLMIEYRSSEMDFLEVYERTYHITDNSDRNCISILSLFVGTFIIALLFLLISKFH